MSANDKIIIKIQADIEDMKQKITALTGTMQSFQREVKNTDTVTQQLNTGLRAFSWGTFIGGTLNASTAIAQLATSTSNLNRVQYLVKQATVSVERAEDQLARKTLQLSKEIEKNGQLSEKAKLLRNEIATASEQLANKEERLALAMDQVNDTYVLFGSNVANTVFGVIQTIIGLKTMAAQRIIANKIAIDQETASLAGNTIAAKANAVAHQGVISARSGLVAGIPAVNTAIGGATGMVGKLTGVLGKAGLIGSIAAVGISLGALAYDQMKSNEKFDQTKTKLEGLAAGYVNLGQAISNVPKATSDVNLFTKDISESIVEVEGKLKEAKAALSDFYKDPVGFSRGKTPEEVLKLLEPVKTLEAEYERLNKTLDQTKIAIKDTIEGMKSGDYTKLSIDKINMFKQVKSAIIEEVELLDEANGKGDEFNEILNWKLQKMLDAKELQKEEIDYLRESILLEKQSNDEKGKGNKLAENQLKYLKQIADLKKKLSPRNTKQLQQSLFESLKRGEYGLSEDYLGLVSDIPDKLGYVPFAGTLDKNLKAVEQNLELVRTSEILANKIPLLEELTNELTIINIADPTNPRRNELIKKIQDVSNEIKIATSGRNITALPGVHLALRAWSSKVMAIVNLVKGAGNIFGTTHSGYMGMRIGMETFTAGQYFRDNAATLSYGRINFKSTAARQAFSNPKRSRTGRSGRRRGRHAPSKGPFYEILNYYKKWQSSITPERDMLKTIDDILGLDWLDVPDIPQYGTPPLPRNQTKSLTVKMQKNLIEKIFSNINQYKITYNYQKSALLHYLAPINITSLQTAYSMLTNPLTTDDIDNMIRFHNNLETISTGATVI